MAQINQCHRSRQWEKDDGWKMSAWYPCDANKGREKGTERAWAYLCICDAVIEEEKECVFDAERKEETVRETQCMCLFKCVCEYVFLWWQNKRPPLSCMALWNLHGFRAPSARGALWLSLELPVCLFPHRRLAKQQGPPPLPRVRSPLNPRQALIWWTGLRGLWKL